MKLTITEVIALNAEIENMLTESSVTFGVKYDLVKIHKQTAAIKANYETQRLEIFKKYGTTTDKGGSYTLDGASEALKNKVTKELTTILDKVEDIKGKLNLKMFADLKSSFTYYVIFKLVS